MVVYNIVSALSSFAHVGCWIAILVVVFGVVRRNRPDAWQSLRGWAIGGLGFCVIMIIAWRLFAAIANRLSSDAMVLGGLTVVDMIGDTLLVVLLLRGLIAIAQPPKPPATVEAPPYR